MRYILVGNTVEVFLEKDFDYEPDYSLIFKEGVKLLISKSLAFLPEVMSDIIPCGIWEERDTELVRNYRYEGSDTEIMCKHFVELGKIIAHHNNGGARKAFYGYFPRVLIAKNEGGYNSTEICVDCLLENLKEI